MSPIRTGPTAAHDVDVAIIGGGITGLSAAWYLQREAAAQGHPLRYALLERGSRWGGKITTEHIPANAGQPDWGEFVVEGGPDSFITQKPWGLQLVRELGLEERLLPTNDDRRQVFVLNNGRPTPLPDGVLLIVPTRFGPFARSPLISPLGKLRMGMELFIPPRRDDGDETLAEFIERRLGSEALDKIAEPLMSGIYNAEAERQSIMATFPRFRALEAKHGSLIRGMLAARQARTNGAAPANNGRNGRRPPSVFVSLRAGMSELVSALLADLSGDLRLNTGVSGLERTDGGYRLVLGDGAALMATTVILAVPAYIASALLLDLAPQAADWLARIRYVSTGTISLAFRRDQVSHPLNGFGLVIPRSEQRPINAVTWTSTKFNRRAPADHVLLRVFFGGSRRPEMMAVDDDELLATVRRELEALLGIDAPPVLHRIYRWFDANPQYDVGHLERVAAIEAALPAGLHVTGSPYRGVGIPDCVYQARETALALLKQLAQPA